MPYKSDRQRRYMHAKHPDIAARWDREEGKVADKKPERGKNPLAGRKLKGGKKPKPSHGNSAHDNKPKPGGSPRRPPGTLGDPNRPPPIVVGPDGQPIPQPPRGGGYQRPGSPYRRSPAGPGPNQRPPGPAYMPPKGIPPLIGMPYMPPAPMGPRPPGSLSTTAGLPPGAQNMRPVKSSPKYKPNTPKPGYTR